MFGRRRRGRKEARGGVVAKAASLLWWKDFGEAPRRVVAFMIGDFNCRVGRRDPNDSSVPAEYQVLTDLDNVALPGSAFCNSRLHGSSKS